MKRKNNTELGEIKEDKNQGKLIIDATCAPADISYPTDLNLLNNARIKTEKIVDILYKTIKSQFQNKPITHRQTARKEYLKVAKKRRPTRKAIRKAIKKQLKYISKNLTTIKLLIENGASLESLSQGQYKTFLVVSEVDRQQKYMWDNKEQRIDDRIVSINQPHVRPIVRGKAGKNTEFGDKLSASCIDGYVFLHRISWDNYNESGDLEAQVEEFKNYTGHDPESVHGFANLQDKRKP